MVWLEQSTSTKAVDRRAWRERPILIVPGLGGSEPGHWQSHWEAALPWAKRVEQSSWTRPALEPWLEALAAAIGETPGAVLVAHSLGCILVAHLAARDWTAIVHGALLVAPPDVEDRRRAPDAISGFGPVPTTPLPFPAIVAASRNDPCCSFRRARAFAAAWNAELADLGRAGHVNVSAGVKAWPTGRNLLDRLT